MSRNRTAKVQERLDAIYAFARSTFNDIGTPVTVRGCFYHLVSEGLMPKTENAYSSVIGYMTQMREDGDLPWRWVSDATRAIQGRTLPNYSFRVASQRRNLVGAIEPTVHHGLWTGQTHHVQLWCEKEGMSGVFDAAIRQLLPHGGVQLVPCGGNPSITLKNDAAQLIAAHLERDMHVHVYYFGDFDPSGWDIFHGPDGLAKKIPRYVERHLAAPPQRLSMEWVTVTLEHIEEYGLQTRPQTKKLSASKHERFPHDFAVEMDAYPPETLRAMIHDCIRSKIDIAAIEFVEQKNLEEDHKLTELRARVGAVCDDLADEGFDMG